MSESICHKVHLCGRVQGVAFRHYTQQTANRLGITGWVRNCPDGSVEAVICGNPEQLSQMQAWLSEGPALAEVTSMQAHEIQPQHFTGFEIRY